MCGVRALDEGAMVCSKRIGGSLCRCGRRSTRGTAASSSRHSSSADALLWSCTCVLCAPTGATHPYVPCGPRGWRRPEVAIGVPQLSQAVAHPATICWRILSVAATAPWHARHRSCSRSIAGGPVSCGWMPEGAFQVVCVAAVVCCHSSAA